MDIGRIGAEKTNISLYPTRRVDLTSKHFNEASSKCQGGHLKIALVTLVACEYPQKRPAKRS